MYNLILYRQAVKIRLEVQLLEQAICRKESASAKSYAISIISKTSELLRRISEQYEQGGEYGDKATQKENN